MTRSPFRVRAAAGTLRASVDGIVLSHAWTAEGVTAGPASNGAQLLHLSVALCILNDTYREARDRGVAVDGVAVEVDGGFDDEWRSTGIEYTLTVDSPAGTDEVHRLGEVVDEIAEIPRAIRAGASVVRAEEG